MPANKKHLTRSPWQRFTKITAGILGGYLVTVSFHMALAKFFNKADIMITMAFSGFMIWVACMICAFLFKKGWMAWIVYLLLSVVFSLVILFF